MTRNSVESSSLSSEFFLSIYHLLRKRRRVIFSLFHLHQQANFNYSSTTMMKFIIVTLVCLAFFLGKTRAFDADDYIAYIEKLSQDEKFVEEYSKWSLELFSQPDYIYGKRHDKFPCPAAKDTIVPTSVHALRPSDVKCVGAMGDSLTAGLGAHALTPIGLYFENRG